MHPGDPVTIPYPITSFRQPLPPLRGGERGVYVRNVGNGLGEYLHEIEINGHIYPLRAEEFTVESPLLPGVRKKPEGGFIIEPYSTEER